MGQKTHPYGLRVGITEPHKSRWYAPKALFGPALKAGDKAPDFKCLSNGLAPVTLADTPAKKEMIRVMSAPAALGRPYLGAIGMQPERLAELRQAFSAALADPGFIADFAKTSGGDRPSPTNGETMQAMLSQVQGAPRPVIERLRKLFNP